MKPYIRFLLLAMGLTAAAACTNTSGEIGSYLDRRTTWFSFISGDDIRAACVPGAPERYRMVYYANNWVQTRIYDLVEQPDRSGALRTRVLTGNRIPSTIDLSDPGAVFRPLDQTRPVTLPQATSIIQALEADGLDRPASTGKIFHSWEYFWIVTACRDGQFVFNAWTRPDEGFARLRFPALVFAADPAAATEPVRMPRPRWQEPDAHEPLRAGVGKGSSGFVRYDLIIREDRVTPGQSYE